MAQARIKQILGLQSTLNALSGVTKIKETISTDAGSGPTGFVLAYDARELNGIIVHVNGVKVESFTWINGLGDTISTTLIPQGSQLVWDSTNAGYDLSDTDIIEIVYETLSGGAIAFNGFGEYSNPGSGGTGPQGPQGPAGSGSGNISTKRVLKQFSHAMYINSASPKFGGWIDSDRLVPGFESLNIGDEIFPEGDNGYRSISLLLGLFSPDSSNTDYIDPNIEYIISPGYIYETGSLRGILTDGYFTSNSWDNTNDIQDNEGNCIMVLGIKNVDTSWPNGPLDNPTNVIGYNSDPNQVIDQHGRLVLLDRHTPGPADRGNLVRFESDFTGLNLPNVNLSDYLAIFIVAVGGLNSIAGSVISEATFYQP